MRASGSPSAGVPSFVHLRVHSEYSIVDGMLRIDDAVAAAARDRMPALPLTDLAHVFGLLRLSTPARKAGGRRIVSCDLWISHEAERDRPHHLVLLCQSREGYVRLCDWLTRAYRVNQHRGRAELKRDWFAEGTTGVIALSSFRDGDVGQALEQGNAQGAAAAARAWA